MADEAAGEFTAVLRAQIADARAQLDQAREAKDLEGVTSLGLRLRYLLGVAADSGVDPDETHGDGSGGRAAPDVGE